MRKEFPDHYDFFPATYILPYEMNLFKSQFFIKKNDDSQKNEIYEDI